MCSYCFTRVFYNFLLMPELWRFLNGLINPKNTPQTGILSYLLGMEFLSKNLQLMIKISFLTCFVTLTFEVIPLIFFGSLGIYGRHKVNPKGAGKQLSLKFHRIRLIKVRQKNHNLNTHI